MALLETRNLSCRFGGLTAVRDFDLHLREGQLLGIIGPNGAGKTTIFNLICGFYPPSTGDIVFRGRNIAGLRPHEITTIGMARTFQNIRMWNTLTVFENLCISQHCRLQYGMFDALLGTERFRRGETAVRRRAAAILDDLGLKEYAREHPKNIPYGLQRRVEIGRALTLEPKLLLLDEPAAGMNPREIGELIELVKWVRHQFNVTILLIEHQMRVVMSLCERIKVLDFGETIAEGTPEAIREDPRVIAAYLGDHSQAALPHRTASPVDGGQGEGP